MRVFVRDKSMARRGVLVDADLSDFMCIPAVDSVEVWSLTLQGSLLEGQTGRRVPHPMVDVLKEPGSGIIVVDDGEVIFSGPMETADRVESADADGDWTFTGVSDDVVLEDALAWPTPSSATPEAAEDSNDVRTGRGSDLIRAYVRANIGEGAPAGRRSLLAQKLVTTSVPSGLGSVITKSPRYQNLLELCQEIAFQSGVHFRVLDQGGQLVLTVFEGRDRHRAVYWTVKDGFLDSASTSLAAPGVTRPLVAGQGQGEERTIVAPTTTDSVASETLWGRRREVFIDQRQTDDLSELTAKGLEALELPAAGFEVHPSVLTGEGFGSSWRLGDVVTVNADRPYVLPVVAAPVRVTGDGVTVSAVLGRMTGAVSRSLSSRVSSLERNDAAASSGVWGVIQITGNQAFSAQATSTIRYDVATQQGSNLGLFQGAYGAFVAPEDGVYEATFVGNALLSSAVTGKSEIILQRVHDGFEQVILGFWSELGAASGIVELKAGQSAQLRLRKAAAGGAITMYGGSQAYWKRIG